MDKRKPTLAIYGIQDRINSAHPLYVHDHAVALMNQGKVISALTLERRSRRKHDNQLHVTLYDTLKENNLLSPADYDLVFVDNVVGRTFLSSCGRFRFEAPLNKVLKPGLEAGRCWWLDREQGAYALNHELAHLGACLPFFGPFKDNSLLVHFDGGASLSNFSAWLYRDGQLLPVEAHWEMQQLSSFFNANALVFSIIGAKRQEQNSVPGKMMGLAGYGTYSEAMEHWLKENDYFHDVWKSKSRFFEKAKADFGWNKTHLHSDDTFLQDVVATMHAVFVRELVAKLSALRKQLQVDILYYSGGSALNIVANTALIERAGFDQVFIPPCCEDSGLALGAAAFLEWKKHHKVELHHPYLNNWGLDTSPTSYSSTDLATIARCLHQGMVLGVCHASGEIGPRALGNRSIFCLANSKQLAQKVSMEHKQREWYRPVAPIMLEENTRYFTELDRIHPLSRYMLIDFTIAPSKRKEIEGAVHVDGTARIQTIFSRSENAFVFDLLTTLQETYDHRALINTSFNIKGEPIVHTADDALKSARNMKLDGVVINGKLTLF
jgi:carbamoyltransferase